MAEALSQDAAVAAIMALDEPAADVERKREDDAGGNGADEGEVSGDEGAEPAADGDEGAEAGEGDQDGADEAAEDDAPAVAAPQWWDAEQRALFENIPERAKTWARQVQAAIAESEAKREVVVQKAKADAQEARSAATKEIETVRGLVSQLDSVIPSEEAVYQQKFGNIDWDKYPEWATAHPHDAAAFLAEYNAETLKLTKLRESRAEAERIASESFGREQAARLREIAPDLANEQGIKALVEYLPSTRIPAEAIRDATAEQLVILNKARLWDELQAKAAASGKAPKAPNAASGKSVRPVAAPVTGTFKQRQASEAMARVKQSGSFEDGVAAILAAGL